MAASAGIEEMQQHGGVGNAQWRHQLALMPWRMRLPFGVFTAATKPGVSYSWRNTRRRLSYLAQAADNRLYEMS